MSRKHFTQIIMSTALLVVPASPANSSIFGEDDRQFVSPARESPYSPVGLVKLGGPLSPWISYTTGFLVDDCHVLTTQVVLGFGQAPGGKHLQFETGIGTQQHRSTRGTVVAAGGLRRNTTGLQQYERGGRDWLLLRLDKCIGASLGHVKLKTGPFSPFEFRDLKSVGYPVHRRKTSGLTLDPSCRVVAGVGSVWLNDCALIKGNSGDPIFRISDSSAKPQMEVYAMQEAGFLSKRAIPLRSGYENQAVPMSMIARQIEPYLSAIDNTQLGNSKAGRSVGRDVLPHFGPSPGVPSGKHLLDTRLATSDDRAH